MSEYQPKDHNESEQQTSNYSNSNDLSNSSTNQLPKPPQIDQIQITSTFYEKYFDPTYKRPYFYNPSTGESLWEVPSGSLIADMTQPSDFEDLNNQDLFKQENQVINNNSSLIEKEKLQSEKTQQNKKLSKKEIEEEKKKKEYQERQKRLMELQQENLQFTHPEYFLKQNQQQNYMDNSQNYSVDQFELQKQQQYQDQQQSQSEEENDDYIDANEDDLNMKDKEFQKDYKLFKQFRNQQTIEWMQRAARRQVQESKKETAYIEGNYDYNIWYDKYLTDRNQQVEKAPSLYRCKPHIDTGYTKADKFEKKGSTYFCVYFARGCCTEGVNCRFYHRIPQEEDLEMANEDNLRDVFGRARHATHKEDNTGIGSFNKECRTLLVTDIQMPTDSLTPQRDIVIMIYENFSPWGEVEDIHFNSHKCIAFIKYRHRYYAEFAREAMMEQVLQEGSTEPISIKWALDNPFDKSEAMRAQQEVQQFQQKNQAHISQKNKKKVQYLKPNSELEVDPHQDLSIQQKLQMKPSELVPQLANPALRKRELKIMEKEQQKDRLRELEYQKNKYSVSEGFEANLYQNESNLNYQQQITDTSKVQENCYKMASVLQQIEKNKLQLQ